MSALLALLYAAYGWADRTMPGTLAKAMQKSVDPPGISFASLYNSLKTEPAVPGPADHPRFRLEDPATRSEQELTREHYQILYKLILDVSEEIDLLRELLNVLYQLVCKRS